MQEYKTQNIIFFNYSIKWQIKPFYIRTNDSKHLDNVELLRSLKYFENITLQILPAIKLLISIPTLRTNRLNTSDNNNCFISLL